LAHRQHIRVSNAHVRLRLISFCVGYLQCGGSREKGRLRASPKALGRTHNDDDSSSLTAAEARSAAGGVDASISRATASVAVVDNRRRVEEDYEDDDIVTDTDSTSARLSRTPSSSAPTSSQEALRDAESLDGVPQRRHRADAHEHAVDEPRQGERRRRRRRKNEFADRVELDQSNAHDSALSGFDDDGGATQTANAANDSKATVSNESGQSVVRPSRFFVCNAFLVNRKQT
jgi:hypothetical protein